MCIHFAMCNTMRVGECAYARVSCDLERQRQSEIVCEQNASR